MWSVYVHTAYSSLLHCTDLHDKLARVRSSHGGALSSCKDPHGPDVERCRAKETAQHHSLPQTRKQKHKTQNQVGKNKFSSVTFTRKQVQIQSCSSIFLRYSKKDNV